MRKNLLFATPLILILLAGCTTGNFVGFGEKTVSQGDIVKIFYTLSLEDGTIVSAHVDGEPYQFEVGSSQAPIPGINWVLMGKQNPASPEEGPMKEGEYRVAIVVPQLAYGPANVIIGTITMSAQEFVNVTNGTELVNGSVVSLPGDMVDFMGKSFESEIKAEVVEAGEETVTLGIYNPNPFAGERIAIGVQLEKIYKE